MFEITTKKIQMQQKVNITNLRQLLDKARFIIVTIQIILFINLLSVIVGSSFNSIGLTRPTLTLESGKFPSPTGWGKRRMRVECLARPTRSRDVT
jgi:hypothetical protein